MGSLIFVVLLSVTGIFLNHSSELRLDQRHVRVPWLLDWYGIEAPPVVSSHAVAEHRITLVGERLYFNDEELAEGITGLVGAVAIPRFIAVATRDDVLLLTRSGTLIERMPLAGELAGGAEAIGTARTALIVRSEGALFQADEELVGFDLCTDIKETDIAWSAPSDVPPDELDTLQAAYRGAGVSVERLLADLHSGRLFTQAGPIVMDAVGIALIALSAFGILLWFRGPRANGNGGRRGG